MVRDIQWTLQSLFLQIENIIRETSRTMIIQYTFSCVRELTKNFFFQQDGALSHYANKVNVYLDKILFARWIWISEPLFWPPLSPNLPPYDLWLWQRIESNIYNFLVYSIEWNTKNYHCWNERSWLKSIVKNWESTKFLYYYIMLQSRGHRQNQN